MWMVNLGGALLIALIVWWFWLYRPPAVAVAEDARLVVVVRDGNYQPARIRVPAGRGMTLDFVPSPCAELVIFPDLELSHSLALHQATPVTLPALAAGEYPFHCQMQMYRGVLVVA